MSSLRPFPDCRCKFATVGSIHFFFFFWFEITEINSEGLSMFRWPKCFYQEGKAASCHLNESMRVSIEERPLTHWPVEPTHPLLDGVRENEPKFLSQSAFQWMKLQMVCRVCCQFHILFQFLETTPTIQTVRPSAISGHTFFWAPW